MSNIINLTPHSITVYGQDQFVNLEQTNPTTLIADSVVGEPTLTIESSGVARVKVSTVDAEPVNGVPTVTTYYGEIEGLPEPTEGVYYVVSLPTISAAQRQGRRTDDLLTPYKAVRSRANGSLVLGCIGFSRN